ncbi:hypothetical protein Tco_1336392 [Tanacetum coccineum]
MVKILSRKCGMRQVCVFTKECETKSKKVKGKEDKKLGNDVPSQAKVSKKMKMKFSKALDVISCIAASY